MHATTPRKTVLDELRGKLSAHVECGDVPGMVALVARGGEVHTTALGSARLDRSVPMRRDTIFRIASMTKPVIAAAAMILVEEGKLRLDQPVEDWLPELGNRQVLTSIAAPLTDTVPARHPILVRHLFDFCMGFGSVMAPPGTHPIQRAIREFRIGGDGPPKPADLPPPDEWLRRLGSLPLMYQPGERWAYNTSFIVPLGKCERLSDACARNPVSGQTELFDAAADSAWCRAPAFPSGAGDCARPQPIFWPSPGCCSTRAGTELSASCPVNRCNG